MVIIDTNIIIDHLRQTKETLLEKLVGNYPQNDLAISLITIQELYTGQSSKNQTKEEKLLTTLSIFTPINYDYEIASLAGKITRDSTSLITFADAAIAASCIYNQAKLATLNIKHFQSIPNIKILDLDRLQ